jgi:penicillin-binding protein 1A
MSAMLAICGGVLAVLGIVGWVVAIANSGPNIKQLHARDPNPPSVIYAGDGSLLGYIHSDELYSHISQKQAPNRLEEATVAIEDRRFWQHGALDYQGILRAGVKDLFGDKGSLQGASTLTMQLVDNRYMTTDISVHHNLRYKIIQAKLAEQLEKQHSKAWILNTYLNSVPYGNVGGAEAIGAGAASEMFFDKPVGKLDLAQWALLAGLPQAPSEYNPYVDPTAALQRRAEVLQAMVKSHYITLEQANNANRRGLQLKHDAQYDVKNQPYVYDYVEQQLIQKFGLKEVENGGLKVYTTIDLTKQGQADRAIAAHEGGSNLDSQPAAGLVSIDPSNGHILAMANSSTYQQTSFDFAANAHRQPGSAFKVFALMTLIHDYDGDPNQTYYVSKFLPAGWLPEDPTWSVHTAEESYQGTISVTKATTVSDNTVFAQLAADIGWDKLDETAHAMGITTHLDGNPSEVIGGLRIGVTPLEMADAYATLANGGYHIAPTIISKVVFPDGSVINMSDPPRTQIFSYGESYAAIQVLKTVVTEGTGTAADYGCPAAGKTGTANDLDNAWFVGFTPKLSTAVWVGYPQGNIPMADGFGGSLAAPIWHDFMDVASDGYCGDWTLPTDPWVGQPYFGPRATTGKPNVGTSTTTTTSTGSSSKSSYRNPTLFSHPPQPPTSTTGGGAPTNFGNGHSGGGAGNGHAGGGGGGGKHK